MDPGAIIASSESVSLNGSARAYFSPSWTSRRLGRLGELHNAIGSLNYCNSCEANPDRVHPGSMSHIVIVGVAQPRQLCMPKSNGAPGCHSCSRPPSGQAEPGRLSDVRSNHEVRLTSKVSPSAKKRYRFACDYSDIPLVVLSSMYSSSLPVHHNPSAVQL